MRAKGIKRHYIREILESDKFSKSTVYSKSSKSTDYTHNTFD